MTHSIQRAIRFATAAPALLALLAFGGWEPASAQEAKAPTRSEARSPGGNKAPAARSSARTAAPRSTAARRSSGRAAQTRSSTPATRRDRGRHDFRRHPRHSFGIGFGYWGGYYPYYYHPYYYPYYWGVGYWGGPRYLPRRASAAYDLGAFDLNVRPKKAEVYLDGQYIGPVKEFDGWPGYLWLEGGTYELIFYRPGFATERRNLTIYPGVVVDVRLELSPGEAVAPDKVSRVDRSGPIDEVRSAYDRQTARDAAPPAAAAGELDARDEPGRIRLSVEPLDASVYLDGRFLGSADELGGLRSGLVVDPGDHLLEVVRPGYGSERLEFRVEEGEELELEVALRAG